MEEIPDASDHSQHARAISRRRMFPMRSRSWTASSSCAAGRVVAYLSAAGTNIEEVERIITG